MKCLTVIKVLYKWRHMAFYILVGIGSGNVLLPNGLLPGGTKPLPEPETSI